MAKDLGLVTAYGYAQAGGYTGTEAEFESMLANAGRGIVSVELTSTVGYVKTYTITFTDGTTTTFDVTDGEVSQAELDTKADAIVDSASGSIASITDGADGLPIKSLNVNIAPKQSGSGDPSPSNVRPISGTDTVNVTRCGKNLFEVADITADNWNGSVDYSITHLQLTKETNGVSIVTYGGESTSQWVLRKFNLIPNEAYSFGYVSSVGNERIFIRLFDGDGNNISSASIPISGFTYNQWFSAYFKNGGQATFTIPDNCSYAWVGFGVTGQAQNTKVYFTDIQLELGSTATDYEPYVGTSYPTSLGQTVYGGTLNVTTGELVIDRGFVTYDGSSDENWERWTSGSARAYAMAIVIPDANTNGTSITFQANYLKAILGTDTWGNFDAFISSNDVQNIKTGIRDITTVDAWRTYLASNPLQVVYELTTPTTVQLTPTEITTLLGNNNIYSSCGDVEVEYRADTKLYIDKKINALI